MNDLSSNGITFDYKLVGRVSSEIMKTIIPTLVLIPALLIGCGMSDEEKANVAAVTCSVMGETRNMDSAIRVREINTAREKIGEAPYLDGDEGIKQSFEFGLCEELVLNDPEYDQKSRVVAEVNARVQMARIEAEQEAERQRNQRRKEQAERERAAIEARRAKERAEMRAREEEDRRIREEEKRAREARVKKFEQEVGYTCPNSDEEVSAFTRLTMNEQDPEKIERLSEFLELCLGLQ